jgi:hypothetical protein
LRWSTLVFGDDNETLFFASTAIKKGRTATRGI